MGLFELCLLLALIGVGLWAFNTYVSFVDDGVKKIINIVVIVACVLIVLNAFGVFGGFHDVPVPRIRN